MLVLVISICYNYYGGRLVVLKHHHMLLYMYIHTYVHVAALNRRFLGLYYWLRMSTQKMLFVVCLGVVFLLIIMSATYIRTHTHTHSHPHTPLSTHPHTTHTLHRAPTPTPYTHSTEHPHTHFTEHPPRFSVRAVPLRGVEEVQGL